MERFVKTRAELERMVAEAYNKGMNDAIRTFTPTAKPIRPMTSVSTVKEDTFNKVVAR